MGIRASVAAVILGALPALTGCSNLFMQKYAQVRTWQLDDDSKVVFREERERNIAATDRWHNYNRDVLTIESETAAEPEASVVIRADVAPISPVDFSTYAHIEVRTDEKRRAIWVVDKQENRRLWSIVRDTRDPSISPDEPLPEMTTSSGIVLKEIPPAARKT